jgi:hypothetical protein
MNYNALGSRSRPLARPEFDEGGREKESDVMPRVGMTFGT